MIKGTHLFKGYKVTITADTKPEDIEWIIKEYPKAKDILIGNDSKSSRKSSKDKPSKGESK